MRPLSKKNTLAFTAIDADGLMSWTGNPSCQAGHDSLLDCLKQHSAYFLKEPPRNENAVKGNLGEFIALKLGIQSSFNSHIVFAANANNPLSQVSRSEIDLLWVYFAPKPEQDLAFIQEVKTTGDTSLRLADALVGDYDKLFGIDPAFTLQTRLQAAKNELELKAFDQEYIERLNNLAGVSPTTSVKTRIIPTLVHEKNGTDPRVKLTTVRTTLLSRGWPKASISAWSISLSDLDARLVRLAQGQP